MGYFLCQYAILKAVPNKNAGFIILLTSVLTLFFFGEIVNLTTFHRLNSNGFSNFSLSFFFLCFLSFLWIGAQFPQDNFLSYARILTLDYYFLLICILFIQTHFGISSLSHPDNALEACALLTPLHIVPEWYFLCQYA